MAVAYWSLNKFIDNLNKGLLYVVRYKNTLYYMDGCTVLNLSTLEFSEKGSSLKNIKDFCIDSSHIKDVYNQIEIVYERHAANEGYGEQLKAAKLYKKRIDGVSNSNPYIMTNSLVDEKGYERKKENVIQYISYDNFMEMAYAEYSEKRFKIRYNDKIYLLKRGLFKSKVSEVFPQKYMIAEFYNYDELFSKAIINEKLLWEIWDNCELIEKRIKVLEKGRGGAVAKVISEKKELDEILQIAQENLIKKGKEPIDKSYHGYHEFNTPKR